MVPIVVTFEVFVGNSVLSKHLNNKNSTNIRQLLRNLNFIKIKFLKLFLTFIYIIFIIDRKNKTQDLLLSFADMEHLASSRLLLREIQIIWNSKFNFCKILTNEIIGNGRLLLTYFNVTNFRGWLDTFLIFAGI